MTIFLEAHHLKYILRHIIRTNSLFSLASLLFLNVFDAPATPRSTPGASDPPLSLCFEAADADHLNRLNTDLAVLGQDLVDAGDLRPKINAWVDVFFCAFVDGDSWVTDFLLWNIYV